MSPTEALAILALTTWAVYKQTRRSPVDLDAGRFKTAAIYAGIGLVVGGFDLPTGWLGWVLIIIGLALSLLVGLARGRLTRLWVAADGRPWCQGTPLTVGLFLGLIVVKFGLGFFATIRGIDDGAGFGEVLVMIALMIAVQAQLLRTRALRVVSPDKTPDTAANHVRVRD